MVFDEEYFRTIWLLDSGYNNNITWDKSLFQKLDDSFRSTIQMGNDSKVQVEGK